MFSEAISRMHQEFKGVAVLRSPRKQLSWPLWTKWHCSALSHPFSSHQSFTASCYLCIAGLSQLGWRLPDNGNLACFGHFCTLYFEVIICFSVAGARSPGPWPTPQTSGSVQINPAQGSLQDLGAAVHPSPVPGMLCHQLPFPDSQEPTSAPGGYPLPSPHSQPWLD